VDLLMDFDMFPPSWFDVAILVHRTVTVKVLL
jgi:hypothetical protein